MAGTVVATALVAGVTSDLPGQTAAAATKSIYDPVMGKDVSGRRERGCLGRSRSGSGVFPWYGHDF